MASTSEYLIVTLEYQGLPPEDRTYRGHETVVVNACVVLMLDQGRTFRFMLHPGLSWKPLFSEKNHDYHGQSATMYFNDR